MPLEEMDAVYEKVIPELSAQLADSLEPDQNPVGDDLDYDQLVRIEWLYGNDVATGASIGQDPVSYLPALALYAFSPQGGAAWKRVSRLRKGAEALDVFDQAQLRELAFWRWVAFRGYEGADPRCFPLWQRQAMMSSWRTTGWPLDRFAAGSVVEIGCGPLGMLEFVPAVERVGFDPLNRYYDTLFNKIRSPEVQYTSELEPLLASRAGEFDLGICYNVLDHTNRPRELFERYFALIRPGGHFLFEVNLVDESRPRSEDHRRMHPSPFGEQKVRDWLSDYSDEFETHRGAELSADNEHFFLAWGRKRPSR